MKTVLKFQGQDRRSIELLAVNHSRTRRDAFTLVELCAVAAIVALIVMTMIPALARTRPNTRLNQCLNNTRQMVLAIQMYTADNHDFYPPNPSDGAAPAGYSWVIGNVQGGMASTTPLGLDTYDPDILTNYSYTLVSPYLNKNGSVFICPMDPRIGRYQGTNRNLIGTQVHAARSISMNGGVGTLDPGVALGGMNHSGVPDLPVSGTWLTGANSGNKHDNPWATFGKTCDYRVVKPSQIFLTLDEDPYSINDGNFAISAGEVKIVDYPASWHNHGGAFSFGDGHVELHRWEGNMIILNAPASQQAPVAGPDVADWNWLWQHATVEMQ